MDLDPSDVYELIDRARDEWDSIKSKTFAPATAGDDQDHVDALIARYGSWGQDERFPRADWQYEVSEGETNLGYWDWLLQQYDIHNEEESDG
jgi:hypothetical protein